MTTGGGMGGGADIIWIDLQARMDGIDAQLAELEAKAQGSGERAGTGFGGGLSAGLAVATTAAVALAGAVTSIAASSFNLAQESAQNVNEFQAKLGVTREEAEALGAVAEQVFANNWTGSLTEAGEAVANVRREIQGLTDEELANVTGMSVAIAETFEEDQSKVAQAIQSVMEATGASVQEATDFIAAGFQNGLNSSEDFLDTLNEYGPQFEKTGISASELFSLLETGSAAGVLGTDKIADALKEFSLRAADGAKATGEAYAALGMSQAQVEEQLRSGTITYAQLFETVTGKLKDVKNEADRTNIIAALFGGAGEDLGKGLAQLDMTKTKVGELAGAADSLNAKYANMGAFMEGMWRQIQVALLPVGKEMLSIANEAAPYLAAAFQRAGPVIASSITQGVTAARAFGAAAINTYQTISPALNTARAGFEAVAGAISRNREVILPLTAGVLAGASAYGVYRTAIVATTAVKAAWTAATVTATAAQVAFRAAITFMTGPIGIAITVIGLLVAAGVALYRNWDQVSAAARRTWSQVQSIIQNAMNGAVTYLKALPGRMLQIGIEIVNGLVNGIRSGAGRVGAAARELADNAWASVKSRLGIRSPSRVMHELGVFTGQGFVNGISSQNAKVRAAAQDTAKSFLDAFKDLKLEKDVGRVDLSTYIKTLEQAQSQLRAKLGTVKEGTPAYREWLGALSAVGKELDSVRGKTASAGNAAADAAKKVRETQESIRASEVFVRWKEGLGGYSDAQLASAKAAAFAAGDQQRYNAVVGEQERRVKAAADALEKISEAQEKIRASEAFDRWKAGLEGYSDAQLEAARTAAFAAGETGQYNAVLAEQERRLDAAKDATERLSKAQQDMTSVVIDEGMDQLFAGMGNQDLAVWRDQSFLLGDKGTWAAARKAMQENGKETAKGFVEGADEMLRTGDYSGALAHLREGLDLLGDQAALGYDVSQGVDQLAGRIAVLENALNELDPVLANVARSGGELFENLDSGKVPELKVDAAWAEFWEGLEWDVALKEFQAGLTGLDADGFVRQLNLIGDSSLDGTQKVELYKLVLAEQQKYLDAAAKGAAALETSQGELIQAQAKLNGVVLESERPFAQQIQNLENLRGKPGVVTAELDALLSQWRDLQVEVEKENQLVAKINEWGSYAKQVIPVVISGFEALGGMSGETADAWAKDMSSMVNDLVSFGTAIAKGDWVGAAVQALTTIFGWLNRNKQAAEEAAKATKAYNEQFRFSDNGYGTREVTTYTTGIFLWKTTHYQEHINEVGKKMALSLEGGFVQGITNGFQEALKAGDFGLFEKSLKQSVGKAVLDGLVEAFLNQAVLARFIGPAIEEFMKTGDASVLDRAIGESVALAEGFFGQIKPIAEKYGLLGTSNTQTKTGTEVPAGSLAALQARISELEDQYKLATNQHERDSLRLEIQRLQAEVDLMNGKGPAAATELSRTVKVEVPEIAASLNFDVLGTLASAVEIYIPMLAESGRAHLEAGGRQLAAMDRLERILSRAEAIPNGRWNT